MDELSKLRTEIVQQRINSKTLAAIVEKLLDQIPTHCTDCDRRLCPDGIFYVCGRTGYIVAADDYCSAAIPRKKVTIHE